MSGVVPERPDSPVSSGYRAYALGLLVVVYVLNFIDRQILTILAKPIADELQFSDSQLGLLTGPAFALFYTFAGIPIARWADVGVRRSIIALALLIWSGMTALTSLAGNLTQLALARVGVGVGEAGCSPPAHSLISDLFPIERRATALSIYSLGIPIGGALGSLLGGWLGQLYGWRVAFLAVGIPGVLLAAVVRLTLREPPRAAVLYFTSSEALLMVVGIFADVRYNLAERIRTGEVVTDLARPVTLYYRDVAERYGTALYYLIARFPPVYLTGVVLFGVAPPLRLEMLLFPLSLLLAVGVSAGLWYVVCASAYFRNTASGELSALVFVNTLLGGMVVPLDFYPDWLRLIADALPFRATLYTPVALLTGKLSGHALLFGLAHQVVWLGALSALSLAIESRGLRRLATQGG